MATKTTSNTLATGLAMFSMFFGAGNVVFPLAIGQFAQDNNLFAILGLMLTAVGVPFMGLMTMTLFDGDYKVFFDRIGKVPGFLMAVFIMGLIGPFGAIPRCITLSYSTTKMFVPELSLIWFSLISCILILIFTIKQTKIVDILGYLLTPLLLGSLAFIIIKGILIAPPLKESQHSSLTTFLHGLNQGYQTMDLLAAFFFSSVVLVCLKKDVDTANPSNYKRIVNLTLKASFIGAFLLGIIYVGFSYVAAHNSESLQSIPHDELLGQIALNIMGPYAGLVALSSVALACLTTAIALAAVSADFIHQELTMQKVTYMPALLITLAITFVISTLDFNGIVRMLAPILQVCYPALIVLSVLNLLYKLYRFQPVKVPFFVTLALSLGAYFWL